MPLYTEPYDVADYLDSDEMIAAYLTESMDGNDPRHIANALAAVARARGGMDRLAKETGLTLGELTPAFDTDKPDFATILKVLHAFGLKLSTSVSTGERIPA
jgi:probable addiction module antidote protein